MTTLKAARGGGLSWGVAEEAGIACRWLARWGLPFAEPLLQALAATPGTITGLSAGLDLADRALALPAGPKLFPAVAAPVLLLPFAARAAETVRRPVCVTWQGQGWTAAALAPAEPGAPPLATGPALRSASPLAAVVVEVAASSPARSPVTGVPLTPVIDGVPVILTLWQALEVLAAKTYVPESDASRRLGAGAGLTDND